MTKLTVRQIIQEILDESSVSHAETTESSVLKEIKIILIKDILEKDAAFHAEIKAVMQAACPQLCSSKYDHNERIYHTHKCGPAKRIRIENRVKLENKQITARLCYFCAQKIIQKYVKENWIKDIKMKSKKTIFCNSCAQKIMHDYVKDHQNSLNQKVYQTI